MTTTSDRPILVTGATGTHGGSGPAAVAELIRRGAQVRAMARREDERSARLRELGAEVVIADFGDFASLLRALDGVDSAYFCYPVGAGIAEAAGLFAGAGRQTGLRRVVDLSLASARPENPSPQGRAQWVAEQIFELAGFKGVHLRIAAFFMENLLLMNASDIRQRARIANSFGDLRLGWLSGQDVGVMAAALLLAPDLVRERVLLAGPAERLSYPEIAGMISALVGRPVRYEELDPETWHAELVAGLRARGEPNPRGADHLVAQARNLRKTPPGDAPDRTALLTGRQPTSFQDFVSAHRTMLTPLGNGES